MTETGHKNLKFWTAVFIATCCALFLRLRISGNIGPYPAEWYIVHAVTDYTAPEYLKRAYISFELAIQPLFFLFSKMIWGLHPTLAGLRIVPLVFGVLSVPALAWCAAKYAGKTAAVLSCFLFAASMIQMKMSVSIQPYSLVMFLSILSAGFFYDAVCGKNRATLLIVNILLILTHLHPVIWIGLQYTALIAHNLFLTGKKNRISGFKYLADLFICLLPILPRLVMFDAKFPHPEIQAGTFAEPYLIFIRFTQASIPDCILNILFLTSLSLSVAAFVIKKKFFRINSQTTVRILWLFSVLLIPFLVLMFSALVRPAYQPRYVLFASVPLLIILSWSLKAQGRLFSVIIVCSTLILSTLNVIKHPSLNFINKNLYPVMKYASVSEKNVYLEQGEWRNYIRRRYYERIFGVQMRHLKGYAVESLIRGKNLDENAVYITTDGRLTEGETGIEIRKTLAEKGYALKESSQQIANQTRYRLYELTGTDSELL